MEKFSYFIVEGGDWGHRVVSGFPQKLLVEQETYRTQGVVSFALIA